jgi:hypothetical protein
VYAHFFACRTTVHTFVAIIVRVILLKGLACAISRADGLGRTISFVAETPAANHFNPPRAPRTGHTHPDLALRVFEPRRRQCHRKLGGDGTVLRAKRKRPNDNNHIRRSYPLGVER